MKLLVCKALALPEGRPEWLHLVPFGEWRGHHSKRAIQVGPAEAKTIIANFARWGIDLVVDFEHQTLATERNGQPAPAMAWVDQVEERSDGVWGHVREWTPRGGAHLDAREYRYLSPVIEFNATDPATGTPRGMRISSAALTNNPFFAGDLQPVLARNLGGPVTLLATLIALLGLPADSTEEQVTNAVKSLKEMEPPAADAKATARAQLGAAVCKKLGWETTIPADAEAQLGKVLEHDGFVSDVEALRLQGQVEALKVEAASAKAGDGVERLAARGLESGKITPAMKPNFVKMAKRDLAAATAFLDTAPVIVPLGTQAARDEVRTNTPGASGLTPAEEAACKALGMSHADYLKGR